jgi:hypothetical protein
VVFVKGLASSLLVPLLAVVQCVFLYQHLPKLSWLSNEYTPCHFGRKLTKSKAYVNIEDDGNSWYSLSQTDLRKEAKSEIAEALKGEGSEERGEKFHRKIEEAATFD